MKTSRRDFAHLFLPVATLPDVDYCVLRKLGTIVEQFLPYNVACILVVQDLNQPLLVQRLQVCKILDSTRIGCHPLLDLRVTGPAIEGHLVAPRVDKLLGGEHLLDLRIEPLDDLVGLVDGWVQWSGVSRFPGLIVATRKDTKRLPATVDMPAATKMKEQRRVSLYNVDRLLVLWLTHGVSNSGTTRTPLSIAKLMTVRISPCV